MSRMNYIALATSAALFAAYAHAAPAWNSTSTYVAGDVVTYAGKDYKAKWWTQGNVPGADQL